MSNIIKLSEDDPDKILLVKKSLIGLRSCYPGFSEWYDSKIVPQIKNNSREIFLVTNHSEFSGALILKNTKQEKKVCTLFVREDKRFNHLGLDLIRIASEELETYKLPITISSEAIEVFNEASSFNFYQIDKKKSMYKKGIDEYVGYILFHNPDKELRHDQRSKNC